MKSALCFAFVLCMFPALSYAGVEGEYTVDTKRLVRDMQASIQKIPKKRQAFAHIALNMAKTMKSQLVLAKRGKAQYSMSMKVFGKLRSKTGSGTWMKKKDGFHITVKGQDNKGRVLQDAFICMSTKAGLACKNAKTSKSKTIYYIKIK